MLHIDLTGRVVSANARFFEVTGLTADEVIGSERLGLVIPDHRGELVRLFNTARAGERAVGSIGVLAVGAGRMPVLATMTPRRAGGEIVGVFAVFTDVSALLRAHDELAEARRQADAALAQRDALLADISHELRTPLTPIMAYSELLIDKAGDRAVVEHAGAEIFTATHKLRNLLDSLLELAELNDKSPTVTVEVAALRAVAEEAIRVAGGTLPDEIRAGVNVEITGDDLSVWADTERLVQAVAGLLRNAITHGAPPVQIHLNSDGHDGLLTVSDHGPGIPAAERERIFTPFVRLNLNHPGQGLGLAMVRRLVHSMDGDVRATDPCEGPGAAFTIRLRRARHGATAVSGIGTTGPAAPQGERPVN